MKLLFLQTGGTIDKAYPSNDDNHGYSFSITEPAFARILERVRPAFTYATKTVVRKDSLDLTNEDRAAIVQACTAAEEDRIIITHGTDTILQTAAALDGITTKTIVLTGALLPEHFKHADADFNLGTAVAAASLAAPGVYVAMSGLVLPWKHIRFDDESGRYIEAAPDQPPNVSHLAGDPVL